MYKTVLMHFGFFRAQLSPTYGESRRPGARRKSSASAAGH
jgi:hypothetical protein